MRKLIALVVLLCGFMPVLWAADGCDQHLSREEFRAKQKAFIIEQAGLNKEEAAKFFPVYFELQDKKKKLNDESWDLMRKGKDDKTTEAQYAEINEKVANNRIAADQLDKTYLGKFKKILSSKKIFLVQRAEMRFHREMIKGMNRSKDKGDDSKTGSADTTFVLEKENRASDSYEQTLCLSKMEALSAGNRASVFYAGKEVTVLFSLLHSKWHPSLRESYLSDFFLP